MNLFWNMVEPVVLGTLLLLALLDLWRRLAPHSYVAARRRCGLWLLRPGQPRMLRRCGLHLLPLSAAPGACGGCRDCAGAR